MLRGGISLLALLLVVYWPRTELRPEAWSLPSRGLDAETSGGQAGQEGGPAATLDAGPGTWRVGDAPSSAACPGFAWLPALPSLGVC